MGVYCVRVGTYRDYTECSMSVRIYGVYIGRLYVCVYTGLFGVISAYKGVLR